LRKRQRVEHISTAASLIFLKAPSIPQRVRSDSHASSDAAAGTGGFPRPARPSYHQEMTMATATKKSTSAKRVKLPTWASKSRPQLCTLADELRARKGTAPDYLQEAGRDVVGAILRFMVACDRAERPHLYE
jgi:hypothetical protein